MIYARKNNKMPEFYMRFVHNSRFQRSSMVLDFGTNESAGSMSLIQGFVNPMVR